MIFPKYTDPFSVIYVFMTIDKDGYMDEIKDRSFSGRRTESQLERDVTEVIDGWWKYR